MTKPYRQRVEYLTEEANIDQSLPDRLMAMYRLVRLMGQRSDVTPRILALLKEAADRLRELEEVEKALHQGYEK